MSQLQVVNRDRLALRFRAGLRPPGYVSFLRTLATVSAHNYDKSAMVYCEWCLQHDREADLSSIVMYVDYLHETKKRKTKSLWTLLSHLRVFFQYCVDGAPNLKKDCPELEHSLKQWQKSELGKQAKPFSRREYEELLDVPDDANSLTLKVAMILGVHGCLRRIELRNVHFEHLWLSTVDGCEAIFVKTFRAKQVGPKQESKFAVVGSKTINIVRKYLCCFPLAEQKGPLFRRLLPPAFGEGSLRGSQANIGINSIGAFPFRIAILLGKNPTAAKEYSGHSFRRTGATFLAESGCSVLHLKQAGGWNSANVAEHYIAQSDRTKLTIARHMGFGSPNDNDSSSDSEYEDDDAEETSGEKALVLRFSRKAGK